MVTAPTPPGSSASISQLAAVFEIEPANVLHGAVRLHGLASSPTPETQVRVACAWAVPTSNGNSNPSNIVNGNKRRISLSCVDGDASAINMSEATVLYLWLNI